MTESRELAGYINKLIDEMPARDEIMLETIGKALTLLAADYKKASKTYVWEFDYDGRNEE